MNRLNSLDRNRRGAIQYRARTLAVAVVSAATAFKVYLLVRPRYVRARGSNSTRSDPNALDGSALEISEELTDDRSSDQFVVLGDILRVLVARKIIIEDRFLCEHFGEDYRRFKQTTKALVPFVI
jgi:protein-S-isoprenylcysteine O-methyltransferase Ste14